MMCAFLKNWITDWSLEPLEASCSPYVRVFKIISSTANPSHNMHFMKLLISPDRIKLMLLYIFL